MTASTCQIYIATETTIETKSDPEINDSPSKVGLKLNLMHSESEVLEFTTLQAKRV